MKLNNSALSKGLQEKYGENISSFQTLEDTIVAVEQYPILIDYISEKYASKKEILLAFIKGNQRYIQAYYDAMDKAETITSNTVIRLQNAEYLRDGKIGGINPKLIDPWLKDKDVLIALGQSHMYSSVTFTDETYDEKVVASAIKQGIKLVIPLVDYWMERIPQDTKTDVSIRTKFNLKMSDPLEMVAFFKVLEIINAGRGDKTKALAQLFLVGNQFYDRGLLEEYHATMSAIMQQLDVKTQNKIVALQYQLALYVKPSEIDGELADRIAEHCIIAGNILPDEYIFKHGLRVVDCDVMQKCNDCVRCAMKNIRIV